VLGIDRGPEALSVARAHAASRGLDHVRFAVSEIDTFQADASMDALVGRFVLMHQRDPVATLAAAARAVRPGGVIVMIESHMVALERGVHSEPHSPVYDQIVKWKTSVVRGAGADVHAGGRLRSTFLDAGLPAPATRLEARLEGGPDSLYYRYVAESVRSMLPEAARLGLGGYAADAIAGLEVALRDEVVASGGVLVTWPVVAGWVTK
jgi:ubiquinone/menaquinone biosynthesis C-methylase UbiE